MTAHAGDADLYTLAEAAERARVSTWTLERAHRGDGKRLPYLRIVKVGNRKRVPAKALQDWIDQLPDLDS